MTDDPDEFSMFDLFREEVRRNTAELTRALQEADGSSAVGREAARNLRGAARIVGVDVAADLAGAIEEALAARTEGTARTSDNDLEPIRQASVLLDGLAGVEEGDVARWVADNAAAIGDLCAALRRPAVPSAPLPVQLIIPKQASSPSALSAPGFSLLSLFRDEVRTHTTTLTNGLIDLENDPGNPQRLEPLMRAAHSIKGAARIVGVEGAVRLAHGMEDVFVAAQNGRLVIRSADIDVFLQSSDLLATLETLAEADGDRWSGENAAAIADLRNQLQAILHGHPVPPASKAEAAPAHMPAAHAPAAAPVELEVPPTEAVPLVVTTFATVEAAAERRPDDPVVRVTAHSLNRLMGLAGESLVQARWLQPFSTALLKLKQQQDALAAALEDAARLLAVGTAVDAAASTLDEARREAGRCRQVLAARIAEFEDHAAAAEDLNSRLYREVIASRMRPFADGAHGFPRLARDMARTLGKHVKLEVLGQSTEVDRDILEKLEAPLTHMVRNAIDHGLENPTERQAAGKAEAGSVRVEARHRAGTLAITVTDDGRGIDPEKLRRKVVDRGLVTPEMAADLSEAELMEFLFLPGFSTAAAVSEFSGRGVGLDVVQDMVRTVGGTLRLTSKPGRGTTFHLQLPITLSVVRAVLVVVGGEPYAFPHNRIDRLLRVPQKDILSLEGRQYLSIDGQNVGLVFATQLLDVPAGPSLEGPLAVILVGETSGHYGLVVDSFIGEQDLVVRPLDARLGKVPNISAAAILDDGAPVLIVDVEDLIRSADGFIQAGSLLRSRPPEAANGSVRKRILVVDDSATVREVERQLLRGLGHDVTLANDGQDGWNQLRAGRFDLVVTDVDMPRMNGLEFVRLIRAEPRFRALPVLVISYKDRDADRRLGIDLGADQYLTKNSLQDGSFERAVQALIG